MNQRLQRALDRANAAYAAMTPEQKAAHDKAQRESFARGMGPCEHGDPDFETCPQCLAKYREAIPPKGSFQERVQPWMLECFGAEIAGDITERCDRFIEEAFELVQALGYDPARILALRDYTYARPIGFAVQEVGGVSVTLAALCLAAEIDMHAAAEAELARIWTKVPQIRAKQAAKPTGSALPIAIAQSVEWRCFHCGDVFTSDREARLHFGPDEGSTAACLIRGSEHGLLEALRAAEQQAADAWHALHEELTDVHRAMASMSCRHQQSLISAEEVGYSRGLSDARTSARKPG